MINDDLLAPISLLDFCNFRVDAPTLQLQNDHLKHSLPIRYCYSHTQTASQHEPILKDKVVRLLKPQRLQIWQTSKLHHGWWSTHQNLCTPILRRRWQMRLYHLLGNETSGILPSRLWWTIQGVMEFESTIVLCYCLFQFLSYEYIIFRLIGIN